jgi:hypothetical protein
MYGERSKAAQRQWKLIVPALLALYARIKELEDNNESDRFDRNTGFGE